MTQENVLKTIKGYFGSSIGTVWGTCLVVAFSDDKTHVILKEHGEDFALTISDFLQQLRDYN